MNIIFAPKDKNKILYAMLIVYALFSFLAPLAPVIFIVPTAVIFLGVFLFDDSDVLCLLAFCACFTGCGWKISQFLTTVDIVLGLLIIKNLIIAIKTSNKRKVAFISIMIGVIILLTIYGLIVTNLHFYKYAQGLGVLLAVASIGVLNKVDLKKLTLILACGIIVSTILAILSYSCGILMATPISIISISSYRFGAYFINVNALALYCSVCQASLLTLIVVKELYIKKWFWLPIIITTIGFSSLSKTFALITVVTYLLFGVIGFISSKRKKRYIVWCLIVVLILLVLMLICGEYVKVLVGRFGLNAQTSNKLNEITTGRISIWASYIKKWGRSPIYLLFGRGITADNVAERSAHNLMLSILYKFGIIGTIALICVVIFIIQDKFRGKKFGYCLPLIVILINGLSEDVACSLYTCLPIVLSIMFVLNAKNKQI